MNASERRGLATIVAPLGRGLTDPSDPLQADDDDPYEAGRRE
jgi:hypothetical protein